jgi:hypothetical protein
MADRRVKRLSKKGLDEIYENAVGNNVLSLKGLKAGTDGQRIPQIVSCGKGNRKW